MRQAFAIFKNTLTETIRQPIYGLVIVLACGIIAFTPAFAGHIFTLGVGSGFERAAERMIADLGMATVLLSGLVLAVFSSGSAVSREIEDKTALTVLSKHISRSVFIIGKYFGVAVSIALATITTTITVLMTVRLGAPVAVSDPLDWGVLTGMILALIIAIVCATFRNYFHGRAWVGSFAVAYIAANIVLFLVLAMFDKNYNFIFSSSYTDPESMVFGSTTAYDWDVARAAILTVEAVLIMAGVAIAVSTRFNTTANMVISSFVFMAGLTSEYFCLPHLEAARPLGAGYLDYPASVYMAKAWYAFVPDLQVFWMSDALTRERLIPMTYIANASFYAVCYVGAMLFLAAYLFQRREIT